LVSGKSTGYAGQQGHFIYFFNLSIMFNSKIVKKNRFYQKNEKKGQKPILLRKKKQKPQRKVFILE